LHIGGRLVSDARLPDHEAGEEGAERDRNLKGRSRQARDPEGDDECRQREKLGRARSRNLSKKGDSTRYPSSQISSAKPPTLASASATDMPTLPCRAVPSTSAGRITSATTVKMSSTINQPTAT
jgi:hypothetical protein